MIIVRAIVPEGEKPVLQSHATVAIGNDVSWWISQNPRTLTLIESESHFGENDHANRLRMRPQPRPLRAHSVFRSGRQSVGQQDRTVYKPKASFKPLPENEHVTGNFSVLIVNSQNS